MAMWNPRTKTGQGLGYYIHWRAENYRKYGIAVNEEERGVSAAQAKAETENRLINWAHLGKYSGEINLLALEDFLNNLGGGNISRVAEQLNLTEQEIKEIEEEIADEIEKDYDNKYSFDFENLNLINFFLEMTNLYINNNGVEKRISIDRIAKIITQTNQALALINAQIVAGGLGKAEKKELLRKKRELVNIESDLDQLVSISNRTSGKGSYFRVDKANKKIVNRIIGKIGDVIKTSLKPTNTEQGKAAEKALALFFMKIAKYTSEEEEKILKDILVGNQNITHTPVVKKGSFLQMDILKKMLDDKSGHFSDGKNSRYQIQNGGIIDIVGSQQTTDLIISLPDGKYGIDGLKTSLKNYEGGFSRGINIVSGVPLLIAFNFVTTDFANHYINLIAQNYGESVGGQANLEEYNNTFQLAILLRGLVGLRDIDSQSTKNLNNVFIMHDKGDLDHRRYYVYDAGTLAINAWQSGASKIGGKIASDIQWTKGERVDINTNFSGWPSYGDLSGANKFIKNSNNPPMINAMERITNVIAYTHKIKLTASITLKNI